MSDSPGYMTPDKITGTKFETKRKNGLDPDAVKAHLADVAATVVGLTAERDALSNEVAALQVALDESATAEPSQVTTEHGPLNDEELTERLGHDAVRVLSEARAAAADRIAEAKVEAEAIRASAEEAFAQRSAEADIEAQRIRSNADALVTKRRTEAEESAAAILASAEANAEQARSTVSTEIETADADAARIIREAELTRRQILEDLARRRSAARRQIEQLRAGRERLLASHDTVRRALDEISEELSISMSEARAAAETAGHSVSDTTIEELEAEIETARLTGLLDTGPVPVVERTTTSSATKQTTPAPKPADSPTESDDSATEDRATEDSATEDSATEDSAEPSGAPVDSDIPRIGTGETAADDPVDDRADNPADAADNPAAATPDEDVADRETTTDSAEQSTDDAPNADTSSAEVVDTPTAPDELASVVQLDRARGEVDTGSHPAKGREASSRPAPSAVQSSPALPSKQAVEAKEKARQESATVTKLESVKTGASIAQSSKADGSSTDDGEVDDLFASLRSAAEKPAPKKKKAKAKKTAAKKSSAKKKKSGATSTDATATSGNAEPDVDSSEMARRLKRVLADEQSKAMSMVKGAEEIPDLEGLLGSTDTHSATYWTEVVGQVDKPGDATNDARAKVDELVEIIRRRVGGAIEHAGEDNEATVAALRSIYRELKTQQVGATADAICRTFPSPVRS